ncbi:hypothetical protein [Montanilutibacter psychrotolerans]|uniref:Flagellar biosynthesis protein n=1 Tax=Montanilutibacter psychrotolerans TaxID=1327343 RepID=A0A3M8SQ33_9GAMM|nr:hypothetical protein [Lysobacter psychrotolerans]RNF82805.1 hypothetical protein EER27_12895 [Lysobacter psychrotolerans]
MSRTSQLFRLALLVPVLSALAACATNRSQISLTVPAPADFVVSADKTAVIETVADQRRFEAEPDEPSTPSLKKGRDFALDAEGRKAAIARKRNGYGMAIGDIVLQPPQTIETITRELVASGLQQRGYRVVDATAAPSDALRVRVGVEEFWAWLTPGFWAIDMEARIKTQLQFEGVSSREINVAAYGKKTAPTGREDNWKQAYERVFVDHLEKQQAAFDQAGL